MKRKPLIYSDTSEQPIKRTGRSKTAKNKSNKKSKSRSKSKNKQAKSQKVKKKGSKTKKKKNGQTINDGGDTNRPLNSRETDTGDR